MRSSVAVVVVLSLVLLPVACTRTVDLGENLGADAAPAAPGDGAVFDASREDTSVAEDAQSDAGAEAAAPVPAYVFVTRSEYDANMGGLAGADQRCQSSAAAAGLGGTYRAWLSDSATDAKDRITGTGPWLEVRTNKVLFPTRASVEGFPAAPLLLDEYGDKSPDRWWTGTSSNGVKHASTCKSWTTNGQFEGGMTGTRTAETGRPGKEWTEESAFSCVTSDLQKYSLVCFGVR